MPNAISRNNIAGSAIAEELRDVFCSGVLKSMPHNMTSHPLFVIAATGVLLAADLMSIEVVRAHDKEHVNEVKVVDQNAMVPTPEGNTYGVQLVAGGAVIARKGPKTMFPTVIRVPDWLTVEQRAHPKANYYLYFSEHHGDHLFMSWAESLSGPWFEFNLGGRFNGFTRRGVFDVRADPTRESFGHLAAPDVHVDDQNHQFIMFFHAKNQPETVSPSGMVVPQLHKNFVATSANGLNFFDPKTAGGQSGHGPRTVTVDGITRDLWIADPYQRAFQHHNRWYSVSRRGMIDTPRGDAGPWEANPDDPMARSWVAESTPSPLWTDDASKVQPVYFSPGATFLASSEFENHPNNPNRGVRITSDGERLNHLSVFKLPGDQLEVFFYVKQDPGDRFDSIYRLVYDIRDSDCEKWDLVRDSSGQVLFEVVVTPTQITDTVKRGQADFKPLVHADPISLGSSYVFMDDDGSKYLFYAYVSEQYSGQEGEGHLSALKLIPKRR